MHFFRQLPFLICAMLVCAAVAAAANLDAAKRAYEQKDYVSAYQYAAPLADNGNAEAQVLIGRLYLTGRGVVKDPDMAIKWFSTAASQGNADAEFMLGSMYLLPRSNTAEGLKWVRLSADHGNQDAQLLLGKTYMDGVPELPRDPVQGDMWLRLAAKNNLPFYQNELLAAEREMNSVDIEKAKELAAAWKQKNAATRTIQAAK
jgi:TPR repeat protein